MTSRALVAAVAAVLTLAACGGDDDPVAPEPAPEVTDPASDGEDTGGDPAADDGDGGADDDGTTADGSDGADQPAGGDGVDVPDDETSGAPPIRGEATDEDREREPVDAALTLTDVRIGAHDGFDRVVFELEGDGEVGWFLSTDDEARSQGSGAVVEVEGGSVLSVVLVGVLLPPDAPPDVDAYDQDRLEAPAGARVVTEVVDDNIFEGHHQLFIGTTEPVAYRVALFEDPQRLVIDLVHP